MTQCLAALAKPGRCELAGQGSFVWEGFMRQQEPAVLFKAAINTTICSPQREETCAWRSFALSI